MKRILIFALLLITLLSAYELNTDAWGHYTVFDPDQRVALLSYPTSWLKPGATLFEHNYEDSSSTYGKWDQILAIDENNGYYFGFSGDIVVKYTPYSFPHRWSASMEFVNYKGTNSTQRTDVVLHYKHQKGSMEYYHTSNDQRLKLNSLTTDHMIRSHGLNVDYNLLESVRILGSIDYNLIEQVDNDTSRTYDVHHEFISVQYNPWKSVTAYAKYHYWYYINEDRQGPAMLFFPGIRYKGKILMSHFSLRLSPTTVHPIFELALTPGPFYIHAYTNARSSRIALQQSAHQYMGLKTGLKFDSKHHYLSAGFEGNYDFVRVSAGSLLNNDFYSLKASGEYRFKMRSADLYTKASYHHTNTIMEGYYHPERAILTAGSKFKLHLAEGNLLLDGDINAQYIIHDDPDDVSFNPSTLSYTLDQAGGLVGDWKINLDIKAHVKTFTIAANVSTPVKFGENINYYLYEGIYTSSDFYYGNAFYAGLSLEWFWWK
ncbi:MAG: hypothetical protein K9N05_07175 [Candidatus Marinimicrobia bacterium]|nr:hypothetical protein [Candidatus Neomarinimicrobiota bacterium]